MIKDEKQIVEKMVKQYFKCLSLRALGPKNNMSYEWARVLFARNGINVNDIKKAIRDYKEWKKVWRKYRKCTCGKFFVLHEKRRIAKRFVNKCPKCFIKIRDKKDVYIRQKEWAARNPDIVKANNLIQGQRYRERHAEEIKRKARIRYHKRMKLIRSSK